MKYLFIILSFSLFAFTSGDSSIYSYTVKTIDGEDFKIESLKGKRVMIVNVASKCGYTPQYKDLQALYKQYGGGRFEIIGFPANNFMSQEPGTNAEIKQFCTTNYAVTFPMMSKISVKGDDQAPIYAWLTQKELNGEFDSKVNWNFQKYLIDENGKLVAVISTKKSPLEPSIIEWIKTGVYKVD